MLVSPVLHFSADFCSFKGQLCTYLPCVLAVTSPACVQVNARKIYDEANVVSGITANKLFSAILIGEAILQVLLALCLLLKTIPRCLAKEIASTGMELDVWSNIVRLHSPSQKGVNLHICTDSACRGILNVSQAHDVTHANVFHSCNSVFHATETSATLFHVQVVIVQYGGKWFQTVPLTPAQWAACTGIGAVSLLVRAGLRLIPTNKK